MFSLTDLQHPLILASNSPRRSALIKQLGLPFEVVGTDIDEEPRSQDFPQGHVLRLAREKAGRVAALRPNQWVIGADTIVVVDGQVLGKPLDTAEAQRMLQAISGRQHRVLTAFSIRNVSCSAETARVVETDVIIKALSPGEIDAYIRTGEPMDKAGAYAAQGIGSFLIREIRGSYTNVVGLPIAELVDALISLNVIRIHSSS